VDPYYRENLALVHHQGFSNHAAACAPGILDLLKPVLAAGGLVLELGCGSGLLTRELVAAGHRVVATDASPAMLELAAQTVPQGAVIQRLTLPDDPIPEADAIVSVGHALNYLPDEDSLDRALTAIAGALRPRGVLALDLCDLAWGAARMNAPNFSRVTDDWAIITEFSVPAPNRFVRQMAVFARAADGSWRRDDERHDNVLVDTSLIPARLARQGVNAQVRASFGTEQLPAGLVAVVGRQGVAVGD
jgi:SAM-dependent methyltransferase